MCVRRPWTVVAGGLAVVVRLTPRGGRDAIDGIEQLADGQSVLKVRVRAAASEGGAKRALIRAHRPVRSSMPTARRRSSQPAPRAPHQAADRRGPMRPTLAGRRWRRSQAIGSMEKLREA